MKALRMFAVLITLLWALPAFAQIDPELLKKAESGDAVSQTVLGSIYIIGHGVPKDKSKANYWIEKAVEQEGDSVYKMLGIMFRLRDEHTEAVQWFQKAAEQGNADAQFELGKQYYNGLGVPEDKVRAAYWTEKAAVQGMASAQYSLGRMYYEGQGVAQDYFKAAEWLKKSADQGDDGAQFILGLMHGMGEGVIRDQHKACGLIRASAEQGLKAAVEAYNELCAE